MAVHSLALRLVLGAGLWIAAALLAGGVILSTLFRDHVERAFDARLDALLESLVAVAAYDEGGTLQLARNLAEPRFDQAFSGWYWQIADGERAVLRSRSLWDEDLPASGRPHGDVPGPDEQRLRAAERAIGLPGSDRRLTFIVAGDRGEIDAALRTFNVTLAWSLGLLGLGLILALLIQVRFGLRPLRSIREAIAAVRAGRVQRLEGPFPVEIAPLSDELNALLEHNATVLERARTQVGNLAHALKTPLSVLANEAGSATGPLAETVRRQTSAMRGQVDHYLARARAAASTRVLGARTDVAGVVEDLRRTLARIHRDRAIAIATDVAPGLGFRGERQDLEEMLGNLADNACKWARTRVVIAARALDHRLVCTIDDDGPGLPQTEREAVFARGRRLDETVPGTGHGLAIVREIAELYEGSVALDRAAQGGLRATLTLPMAPPLDTPRS